MWAGSWLSFLTKLYLELFLNSKLGEYYSLSNPRIKKVFWETSRKVIAAIVIQSYKMNEHLTIINKINEAAVKNSILMEIRLHTGNNTICLE